MQFLPSEINIRGFGHLGVALFFFLSGYGLQEKVRENEAYLKGFLKKRIVKLYIPYLVATFVYIIIRLVFGIMYTIKEILISLGGFYTIVNFSWYIFLQLVLYLVFWFIYKKCDDNQRRIKALTVVILLIMGVCVVLHLPSYYYVSLFAFPLGVIVSEYQQSIIKITQGGMGIIFITLSTIVCVLCFSGMAASVCTCIFQSNNGLLKVVERGEMILCDISFTIIIVLVCSRIELKSKFFTQLGMISYEIYLFQGLFIKLFSETISLNNNFVFTISVSICVIITSIVLNKLNGRLVHKCLNYEPY